MERILRLSKILSDKKLYSADETLALIPDSFLKVLSIIRHEDAREIVYQIDEIKNSVVIKTSAEVLVTIPIFQITEKLVNILRKIKALFKLIMRPNLPIIKVEQKNA